ncbi:MAG: GNAT family N-acetyltransferase [Pirellulaceae bacterium]
MSVDLKNCRPDALARKSLPMGTIPPHHFETQDGTRVVLRSASLDDAPALVDCCKAIWLTSEFFVTQADEFDLTEKRARKWIRKHRDSSGSLMLLAEVDNTLVGLLNFQCGGRRRVSHQGTFSIAVHAEFQGMGIGSVMLQTLVDWGLSNPTIEKLSLSVFATNCRAIKLYRRFGFVEEGRRIKDVKLGPGRYVDDIVMARFVCQDDN